ncbi:AbrB/MazE/SpoVT family DNA-binding domain-containing protein [Pseudomonas benzenivorans]|uniref:AbrB/MazE/SpoVT family DNA-binding domain-containing protein n=1 Tax=Pseudomonas benzenivorans TaxID=556533 RepID=UPI002103C69E|nr:AbrB/MazE/SpoVT family DNA-binding domain-containing protein [Pseudomonas benzenivorans]
MTATQVVIEDWDGDGIIRVPDEVLQTMGVDVGDSLYLIEEYVGTTRCIVLSKTPRVPDRVDDLFESIDSAIKQKNCLSAP